MTFPFLPASITTERTSGNPYPAERAWRRFSVLSTVQTPIISQKMYALGDMVRNKSCRNMDDAPQIRSGTAAALYKEYLYSKDKNIADKLMLHNYDDVSFFSTSIKHNP